ncbi:MAG: B-box zinc finger protein [Candidatus Bathyarchaeia archaeon]|nr:hypothetical protein [Candidatus Bathyarchaeota archaeon]
MVVLCEECGRYQARYVCEDCGKRVCAICFDTYSGLCKSCLKERYTKPYLEVKPIGFMELPLIMILLGVTLMFIGALLIGLSGFESGSISGGIVVIPFIPIPIGLAFGPYSLVLVVLAYILAVIFFVLAIIWWRRIKKI